MTWFGGLGNAWRVPVQRRAVAAALACGALALAGCAPRAVTPGPQGAATPRAAAAHAPDPAAVARAYAQQHPESAWGPFRIAELALAHDSLAVAEAALDTALARAPWDAPALSLRSRLEFERGRNAEAIALLAPARTHPEAFSNDALRTLLLDLALHEDALGRLDSAAARIAEARALDPERAESAPVFVVLRGAHPEQAAPLATRALRAEPASAVALNNDGIARLRGGDPESARRAFRAAIAHDPTLPGPYYNLAILEKWYALDDGAAATAFAQYWSRSHDDPDSLRAVFAPHASAPVAQEDAHR